VLKCPYVKHDIDSQQLLFKNEESKTIEKDNRKMHAVMKTFSYHFVRVMLTEMMVGVLNKIKSGLPS